MCASMRSEVASFPLTSSSSPLKTSVTSRTSLSSRVFSASSSCLLRRELASLALRSAFFACRLSRYRSRWERMSAAATMEPFTNSSCSVIFAACSCSFCITLLSAPICTRTLLSSASSFADASFWKPMRRSFFASYSPFDAFSASSLAETASSSPCSFLWYASCLLLNLVSMTNLRLRYSSSVLSRTPNSLRPAAICSSALMLPLRRWTSSLNEVLFASICCSRSVLSCRRCALRSISLSSFFSISSLSNSSFFMNSSRRVFDLTQASRLPRASSKLSIRYSSWSSLFLLSFEVAPSLASTFSTFFARDFRLCSSSSTSLALRS
mmetsp:Transcript_52685/g.107455  ORF Transcript_52685/g.107455 Transcript_52685/m.107455 type:complete len:324 (+) Transcript_52685:1443-2414(+)